MPEVYISGYSVLPIVKQSPLELKHLAAQVALGALKSGNIDKPDCLIISNMLSDELEGQKHLGPLIATECGLSGIEAWHVRAATAGGAAALRAAWLAVKSGEINSALVVGVEKMHRHAAQAVLAKALDLESEIKKNHTMVSINAAIMKRYLEQYKVEYDKFSQFAINAHQNALNCSYSLFKKPMTTHDVMQSRMISDPMRLADCSPVCDGAAAILLSNDVTSSYSPKVKMVACEVATDSFSVLGRKNPLELNASVLSSSRALQKSGFKPADIDFFELHDAFSIMACLALEACGFAKQGEGWKMAHEGHIFPDGNLPISTFGGLKARGHPVGATALYQASEIYCQLTQTASANQLKNEPQVAMMQSIGGAGASIFSSIFCLEE